MSLPLNQSARTAPAPSPPALSCCLLQTSKKQQCAAVLSCTAAAATLLPLLLPWQLLRATCSSRQLHRLHRRLLMPATAWQ